MLRIGIDLGGSKTEVAAFDATGAELLRRRAPTPSGDYAATLTLIATLIHDAERTLNTRGSIGIALWRRPRMSSSTIFAARANAASSPGVRIAPSRITLPGASA